MCKQCSPIKAKPKLSQKSKGENNAMYGKSFFDVWVKKYGINEANKREQLRKEKISKSSSGENNPMYGKPSPKGSGNGWSGHYKNHHFRSILELSYLKYLLDNDIKFESAELSKHAVDYQINNEKRKYFPDYYLLDTNEYIELKPKKLVNIYQNKLKFDAAIKKHGSNFKIITEENVNKIELKEMYFLYINKEIIFDKGYAEKFENYYKNCLH